MFYGLVVFIRDQLIGNVQLSILKEGDMIGIKYLAFDGLNIDRKKGQIFLNRNFAAIIEERRLIIEEIVIGSIVNFRVNLINNILLNIHSFKVQISNKNTLVMRIRFHLQKLVLAG